MVWLKGFLVLGLVLATTILALGAWGSARWRTRTQELVERLEAARTPGAVVRYDSARELPGLPLPVQRFFHAVLREGQPLVTAATVEHTGSFNLSASGQQWKPFRSWQRVTTQRPGFVWDGTVSAAPGLPVHVHDAYVAGEGILRPAVLGLFTPMHLRGSSPEPGGVAHGELMRFLAEAAWYPTALLPSQGVHWEPVDESHARATLRDGELGLALTFTFAADGTIGSVLSDARGRTVDGRVELTPWEGRWSDWQLRDGLRVPLAGEVAWLTREGRKPYWRGRIESLRFEWAPA